MTTPEAPLSPEETPQAQEYYYPLDGHLNPRGYDLMAASIAERIPASLCD